MGRQRVFVSVLKFDEGAMENTARNGNTTNEKCQYGGVWNHMGGGDGGLYGRPMAFL